MLVVWNWRSFFRAFFLTLLIAFMMLGCGIGIQAAFRNTEKVYGAVQFTAAVASENIEK